MNEPILAPMLALIGSGELVGGLDSGAEREKSSGSEEASPRGGVEHDEAGGGSEEGILTGAPIIGSSPQFSPAPSRSCAALRPRHSQAAT